MYTKFSAVLEKSRVKDVMFFWFWIRRWFHDSSVHQHWQGNEDTHRKTGELVRKNTAHSRLHRRQHLQFLCELRGEVNRDQYFEQFSAAGKRRWQSSALVSPTKTLNTDLAPNGDDIERMMKMKNHWKQRFTGQE